MTVQEDVRFKITDEQRQAYNDDGVIVLRDVVSAEWRDKLAGAIERDIENPGPHFHGYKSEGEEGNFHGNLRIWQNDEAFHDYCLKSVLPDIAQQLFQSEKVNLLYDQLFVKEPGTENPTPWHNDQPFWPVGGRHVLSFWTSLDPVTADSGALNFVRGSHNWDRWFQPANFGDTEDLENFEKNDDYEPMPDIDGNLDDYDIVTWDLEPGDVYVFQGLTVHGSGGNFRKDRRRRGYTVRYTGDDAFYDPRKGSARVLQARDLTPGDPMAGELYPRII